MIAGSTIGDAQILKLRGDAWNCADKDTVYLCCDALGVRCVGRAYHPLAHHAAGCDLAVSSYTCVCRSDLRMAARARCAELINARAKEQK